MNKLTIKIFLLAIAISQFCNSQEVTLIDFGSATLTTTSSAGTWNNVTSYATGTTVNLKNTSGNATSAVLTLTGTFFGLGSTGAATPTSPASTIFPASSTSDYISVAIGGATIDITGLNPSATYTFDFFSSKTTSSTCDTKFYLTAGANTSVMVNAVAQNNTGNYVSIADFQPDASGKITIYIRPGTSNTISYEYLNAMRITATTPVTQPTSSYTYTVNDKTVTFTNTSTNATGAAWDFGDGTNSTTTSPVHTYTNYGNYTVTLTSTNANGSVNSSQNINIAAPSQPVADYSYTANGLSVTFTNTSTNATSYSWDFGDGTAASTSTSPSHTFTSAGSYTVVLTATNAAGSNQKSVLINVVAATNTETIFIDFGGTSISAGNWNNIQAYNSTSSVSLITDQGTASNISLAINKSFSGVNYAGTTSPTGNAATLFSASSGNATSDSFYSNGNTVTSGFILSGLNVSKQYSFDVFASRTSVSDNREAKYTFTGQNTVYTTLNAANNTANVATVTGIMPDATGKITFLMEKGTNNTEASNGYIYLGAMRITSTVSTTPPTANYTYVATGLTVNFTNTSVNATSYSWDFGDGSPLSTSTSASHTYATEGNYTVVLTATNINGVSTYNQNITVIREVPVTNFTYSVSEKTVTFSNTSINATSYNWNFGDGSTSTQTSPTHLYSTYGDYSVQLTATNSTGSTTTTKTISVSQKLIKKILFLGNSYVFTANPLNIPQVLQKIAASMGDSVYFASNSYPSASFQTHVNNTNDMDSIRLGKWDFVSMNDYSRQAAFPPNVFNDPVTGDYHYAKMLTDSIVKYNPCGQPMFYMSWGWPAGDASYCAYDPTVCTFKGMDDRAQANYMYLGTQINAIINPVGTVRRQYMDDYNKYLPDGNNAKMDLFSDYNGHPTALASYFSACCFYTAMFRKDPTLITYNYTVPADTAAIVRAEVKKVLYNNLLTYNIGKFDPIANYSYVANGQNLAFTNTSTNANTYSWDFGDGTTSSATNPSHDFVGNGPFTVKLTAQKCNKSDTKTITVDFTTTRIENDNSHGSNLNCYPNPVTGELTLNSDNKSITNIKVFNSTGKMIMLNQQTFGNNVVIDFSKVASGIYFVKVEANGKTTSKIITKK